MTKLAMTLCAVALALTACGAESEPDSAKPAAAEPSAETSAPASEPVGAPHAPEMTKSQVIEGLGLSKPTAKYEGWVDWTYTTSKGVTCGVQDILIGKEQVALYANAGDTVANNGVAGVVLLGDPFGDSDDAGYAVEKACYDELSTKMATMVGG
jgi:hypothetical protein